MPEEFFEHERISLAARTEEVTESVRDGLVWNDRADHLANLLSRKGPQLNDARGVLVAPRPDQRGEWMRGDKLLGSVSH